MSHGGAATHPDRAREWEPQRHRRGPRGRSLARAHSTGREWGGAYRLEADALRVPTELVVSELELAMFSLPARRPPFLCAGLRWHELAVGAPLPLLRKAARRR